ncbi:hypothetical protein SDC9_111297 [bioreactor metagenome]|uniref:Uncharacterized protein n=1 Tax=bioreactor metagenome TaxID=1076179 RepID=A0A645BIL4_9ZZZZ
MQRAGDLVQIDGHPVVGHAQAVADLDDELQRVERHGLATVGLFDGRGRNAPVAQRHELGVECVFDLAVAQRQPVAFKAGGVGGAHALRLDQPFM